MSQSDKDELGFVRGETYTRPSEVLKAVEDKKEECVKKQWALYTSKSGDKVLVRDALNKVCGWLEKFIHVGDNAAQLAPGHATIPWIASKDTPPSKLETTRVQIDVHLMLVQMAVNDCQTFGNMVESLEVISSIIARYTELEARVLIRTSNLTKQLSTALVKLYGYALRFLVHARQYYGRNTLERVMKSAINTAKSMVEEPMLHIEKQEGEVYKLVCLVQDECIGVKLENIIEGIKQSVDNFHASGEERRKRFSSWINGIDTKNTYETALQYHHSGTCEWALKLDEFCAWEAAEPPEARLLWIHGPAGFGKTFISAWIIRHLEKKKQAPLCYFFCVADNQLTRDPYAALRSWLTQMLEQDESVLASMESVYKARNKEQTLTQLGLWELFVAVGESIDGCTFVIDGFDECIDIDTGARYHRNDPRSFFLRDLLKHLPKTKSRVLVVSRDVPDINEFLGQESADYPGIVKFEYEITAKDTTADVRSFSEHMVNSKLPKKKEDLRQKIAEQAAERSEGMFLWIKLLEQEISPGQNAKELTKTVHEMPSGISEAYSREVERIGQLPPSQKDKAVMILRWILFAVRPLQVKELAEALVISGEELEDYPDEDLPDMWQDGFVDEDYVNEMILGRCGSLLQLRSNSPQTALADHTVHFVHFSVKEYLSSLSRAVVPNQWAADLGLADAAVEEVRLSRICLRYLTLNTFEDIPPNTNVYPFLSYASWAWYFHSFHEKPTPSQDIMHRTQKAFDPATSSWKVWTPLMEAELTDSDIEDWNLGVTTSSDFGSDADSEDHNDSRSQKVLNPIYYASLLGLTEVVKWLEDQGLDCACAGGHFGFPLQAAVVKNHEDVVKHLLNRGVDVSQKGGQYGTSIIAAAAVSTLQIVKILLTANPDLNATDEDGWTALHHATIRGAADIVRCLLKHNADPNLADKQNWTPLALAAAHNDVENVKALLDAGANVSGSDVAMYSPLQVAVVNNCLPVVKILHEHGADLDQGTKRGLNALLLAVSTPSRKSAELLLDLGASMKCIWEHTQETLFDSAIGEYQLDIAQLLVSRGCFRTQRGMDTVKQRGIAGTAVDRVEDNLVILAYDGDSKGLENYLVETCGSLPAHILDEALHAASARGNLAIVQLLLRSGAQVDECDLNGRTALHYATRHLHFDVADLLVENGASISAEDDIGSTPIDLAVVHGKKAIGFIQKHMESFTLKISRRPSLLAITPNQLSNLSMLGTRKAISGSWTGHYEHLSWFEGRRDVFAIDIPSAPPRGPCTFSSEDEDVVGKFQFLGFVDPIGIIWFVKLYQRHGWLYRGQLDTDRQTLKGTWGSNRKLWFGTFELKRRDRTVHEEVS